MPTLVLLAIAFQFRNRNWRYAFFTLAAINLIFNIWRGWWASEIYAVVTAVLLALLNPKFKEWWQNRKTASEQLDFRNTCTAILNNVVQHKFETLFWVAAFIISSLLFYQYGATTGYHVLALMSGLALGIFLVSKIIKSVFPSQFLQSKSTNYILFAALISWGVSLLIYKELDQHFLVPMSIVLALSLLGGHFIRGSNRFLVPGCSVFIADLIWQVVRLFQNSSFFVPEVLYNVSLTFIIIIIGIIWLMTKPGILPIIYLSIFQLFRFAAFEYEAVYRASTAVLTVPEVTFYLIYLVCWMFLVPIMLWFLGMKESKREAVKMLPN